MFLTKKSANMSMILGNLTNPVPRLGSGIVSKSFTIAYAKTQITGNRNHGESKFTRPETEEEWTSNTGIELAIKAENQRAAMSRVSDVDRASQMANFTIKQIIPQTAVSMFGQNNPGSGHTLRLIDQ